jgi:uncharacterized membrane protein
MTTDQIITLVPTVVSFVLGLVALWQNKKKRTTQKILETVIMGVERAATLPPDVISGSKVKDVIRIQAVARGVQPILHDYVQRITQAEPPPEE